MDNRSNEVLFDEGMRKAKELVSGYIFDVLTKCCEELIQDALDNKSGFRNLTGNTITSYACGLFMDGRFSYFVCSGDSMKQPVRVKLTKGETFVGVSYDNQNRLFIKIENINKLVKTHKNLESAKESFKEKIKNLEIPEKYSLFDKVLGKAFSFDFLKRYKSESRKGFEIVMCTGTEYSTYLENVLNADVLTGTFQRAQNTLFKNFKPMK